MSDLPEVQNINEEDHHEMSFLDHLEELRWHIIRACIAIGVFTIAAFLAKELDSKLGWELNWELDSELYKMLYKDLEKELSYLCVEILEAR